MKIDTPTPLEHQIDLILASGAHLKLLYFSDREARWIFAYNYVGEKKKPGEAPDVVNKVQLTADYAEGLLTPIFMLSMHVIIPSRLGQSYFAGVDVSPGGKTYLEFHYERADGATEYRLVAIGKGARDYVRLDTQVLGVDPAPLVRPIEFPFPIPDRLLVEGSRVRVPFRLNNDEVAHFELPTRTLR